MGEINPSKVYKTGGDVTVSHDNYIQDTRSMGLRRYFIISL